MPDAKPDLVRGQYESWVYPEPVSDLTDLVRNSVWNGGDPKNLGKAYWPDRPVRKGLEILVAGCGTYAAALYALKADGVRTILQCIQSAGIAESSVADVIHLCRKMFRDLWRVGYFHFVFGPGRS
jgi:hypothetical protein